VLLVLSRRPIFGIHTWNEKKTPLRLPSFRGRHPKDRSRSKWAPRFSEAGCKRVGRLSPPPHHRR
jgi:hypothetical protein